MANIETGVDKLVALVAREKKIEVGEAAKRLNVDTAVVQEWAEFLEEEAGLFIEGTSRICGQPEFQDLRKLRTLLEALDEKNQLLQMLLGELSATGVRVRIGRENENGSLEDVSLVVKDCYVGGVPVGGVAVVGPTRMDYPKVCAIVDFVADSVTEAVKRF